MELLCQALKCVENCTHIKLQKQMYRRNELIKTALVPEFNTLFCAALVDVTEQGSAADLRCNNFSKYSIVEY